MSLKLLPGNGEETLGGVDLDLVLPAVRNLSLDDNVEPVPLAESSV
jgi:hypothetical protein